MGPIHPAPALFSGMGHPRRQRARLSPAVDAPPSSRQGWVPHSALLFFLGAAGGEEPAAGVGAAALSQQLLGLHG